MSPFFSHIQKALFGGWSLVRSGHELDAQWSAMPNPISFGTMRSLEESHRRLRAKDGLR
jgi:hypothetical protein